MCASGDAVFRPGEDICEGGGRGEQRGSVPTREVRADGGALGGDGGRDGDVYVEVDRAMNSLPAFWNNVHFRAEREGHRQGSMQSGAKGEDVVVKLLRFRERDTKMK